TGAKPVTSSAVTATQSDAATFKAGDAEESTVGVTYRITLTENDAPVTGPIDPVRGEVNVKLPGELIGLRYSPESRQVDISTSDIKLPASLIHRRILFTGQDDPVSTIAKDLGDAVKPGTAGRSDLTRILDEDQLLDAMPSALHGPVLVPKVLKGDKGKNTLLWMSAAYTSAEAIGAHSAAASYSRTRDAQGGSNRDSATSVGLGGDISVGYIAGLSGAVDAGAETNFGVTRTTTYDSSVSDQGTRSVQITGDGAMVLVKMKGTLSFVSAGYSVPTDQEFTEYVWMPAGEAAELGLSLPLDLPAERFTDAPRQYLPPYTNDKGPMGPYDVLHPMAQDGVRNDMIQNQISEFLRNRADKKDFLPQPADLGTEPSADTLAKLLANQAEMDKLSLVSLAGKLDDLGAGVTVTFQSLTPTNTFDYEVTVRAVRDQDAVQHKGLLDHRAIGSGVKSVSAANSRRNSATSITVGGTGRVRLLPVAGTANVVFGNKKTRSMGAASEVTTSTALGGQTSVGTHAFDVPLTYDITVTKVRRARYDFTLGRQAPSAQVLARTGTPVPGQPVVTPPGAQQTPGRGTQPTQSTIVPESLQVLTNTVRVAISDDLTTSEAPGKFEPRQPVTTQTLKTPIKITDLVRTAVDDLKGSNQVYFQAPLTGLPT
ncbi:hypothetical protein AB0D49_41710, partial [Streptomyces sp. NPDC048290]|uniref:hypothetical protein n=1 Tax=Streptomyces sp. NPDC048290 TaxID=3155811 RepID=UPI00343C620B